MARSDTRDWAQARRDRTRHLIELGGLLTKAGLVELVQDDRATLLGALLELAGRLREGDDEATPAGLRARWRHAGLRAFHQEREAEADAARRLQGEGTAAERGSA
ncbi:conjugal transfer protein TraD [Roseomonas chloroacetimidivorans]|uniref:conjugal transfer protein TraD n=1 Tax=Roseomonas chloroacetimidivorans TaxID=1766656 RepID=UPI003C722508